MENVDDEEICRRFLANPKINPITGGRLISGKTPYNTYIKKSIFLKSIPLKSIPLKSIPLDLLFLKLLQIVFYRLIK